MNRTSKAKVFVHSDRQWEEICVGYVQIVHTDGVSFIRGILEKELKQCPNIVKFCHMNTGRNEWCINLRVNPEITYEQQGDNIISWEEIDQKLEIAISFIDCRYSSEFWNQLQNSRRNFRYDDPESTYPIIPSQQNLEAVQLWISDNPDLIIQKLTTDPHCTFLEELTKIFQDAEAQQHQHTLEQLHYVIRNLIYLKNLNVLKRLLSDKFYMTLFGIMEYHSEYRGPQRVSYRNFLTSELKFHLITELNPEIMEKIHFNYRLSYLKDSVMAYYLYLQDPIYYQFNFYIIENNKQILESLLLNHKEQFEEFLINFIDNLELNCKFINEFFLSFKQFLQIQSLNDAFVSCIGKADLLRVLFSKTLEIQQQQLCFTTLQLTIMIANSNSQYFQEFLKQNQELFWQSMETLLLSNMTTLNSMIIDIIQYICQNQAILGQGIDWLMRCFKQRLNSSAIASLQEIVQLICQQQKTFSQELIILSNHILDILDQQIKLTIKDKFMIMPTLKHFKYLCTSNYSQIVKPYCESFIKISTSQKIFGVLEGQIRDIIKYIKSNTTLSQYIVIQVRILNLQDHSLYAKLVQQYSYVRIEDGQKTRMQMEDLKYYEKDDSEEQALQQQQQTIQLIRQDIRLNFSKIVRKRNDEDEDEDEVKVRESQPKGIIFRDNCFKRIKTDDDDDDEN
ncbi:unnamed protein product [Paramecium sonneborni]|uniref:Serine/threonine-protein phosphatase 4 regulatory subunit 3-like central domain-containing protein n=1 Tax=Paramecium sonneborni TaxID=65129 RepID=A0A8S1RC67_9CILI|nr:unnamed protein product [Paramecium sonneborni]